MMQEWPGQPVSAPAPAPAQAPQASWPGQAVSQPSSRPAASGAPRGVRNRNAGNLKDGPFARRQPGYQGGSGGFAVFDTPEAGNAAQEALLSNNYINAGHNTPRAIVGRYAPVGPENSPASVENYTNYIAGKLGISPDDVVSPQQVAALAQAMREFENGQTTAPVSAPAAEPASGAPDMLAFDDSSGGLDLKALMRGEPNAPEEVVIDNGLLRENGHVYTLNQDDQQIDLGSDADWEALSPAQQAEFFRAAANGRSAEYRAEYEASRAGAENVPAWMANLSQGQSLGIVGNVVGGLNYLNPFTEGVDRSKAFEAGRDAWRDNLSQLAHDDPLGSIGMQMAGGLLTPGLKGTGDWISGATGAERMGRAAVVTGAYGAIAGAADSEEADLGSRLQSGLLGGAVGAATGGLLDAGMQRASAGAARRFAEPSAARRLSRQGVDLTPGQMAGGTLRRIEDGLTSLPIMGDSIRNAQRRGLETFDNVATNTAIEPIGVRIADTGGRQGVRSADDAISQAYNDALQGVVVARDATADAALANARRADRITPDMHRNLNAILDNTLAAFDGGPVDGQAWKEVDSQLAAAIRAADKASASAPEQRILRDRLTEAREAVAGMLERTDPDALAAVRQADRASAQYRLVRKASADVASAGRGGNASPATLNRAVVGAGGERRAARGESLLQDLTDDAMQVMPSTVPDSGTPFRGLLSALGVGTAATVGGFDPLYAALIGGGLVGGGAAYGPTAQRIANGIYRATDRRSAFSALAELERFAGRNPALQPYYQAAVEHVQGAFGNRERGQEPAATGLLSPTAP